MHTAYFGSISWYRQLLQGGGISQIDATERFVKQTERSRCRIATANGVQTLSVPVNYNHGDIITDVRISDHNNWRHLHWQALSTAYGSSPFFEFYADDIAPFFEKKWEFLYDYNMEITCKILEIIGCEQVKNTHEDTPYYQTFQSRHGFIPDLSILDLLFNMGPESVIIL